MNEKIQKILNDQINAETYSAYLYLSMAAYFANLSLDGCANWMRVQAQEEMVHAMKFFDFVIDRGGRVELEALGKPQHVWGSPLEAFEASLEHEKYITGRINAIADLALREKDNAANNLAQWFVNEQVEEEASVDDLVRKLKLVGQDGPGLFMIDRELKQRVFTPPATGAGAE